MPSLAGCKESFGLSALESISVGTPVLATPYGALSELITHGKNGILLKSHPTSSTDLSAEMTEQIEKLFAVTKNKKNYFPDASPIEKLKNYLSDTERLKIRREFSEEKMLDKLKQLYLKSID